MSNITDGKIGLYYDMGNGVNKAEALRQEIIFKIAHIKINYEAEGLADELDDLFEDVDELAELAGAKVFEEKQ